MNHLLEVCLIVLTLATSTSVAAEFPLVAAGNSFAGVWEGGEATAGATQPMQKGVSVKLPVSSNAVPLPDADKADSLILSVTHDGTVYVGVDPISPAVLAEKVKGDVSRRTGKKLYIKADARTPYANVIKVLDAMRAAGVEASDLLTSQRDSAESGTLVPPKGLEVLVGSRLPSDSDAAVVQVLNSRQRRPTLKINHEQVPWAALQSSLRQLFQSRSEKVVLLKADGILPFVDVVDVTDTCRSMGVKVALVTPRP